MAGRFPSVVLVLICCALVSCAAPLKATQCDACLTVVEEYFQKWMEAKEDHQRALTETERDGPRTWWSRTEAEPLQNDISFEKRLEATCTAERLSVYQPAIRAMCNQLLVHPESSVNRQLAHSFSSTDDIHTCPIEDLKLEPGERMHVGRVPALKWMLCTQLHDYCDGEYDHRAKLTDRCGMCHRIAKDLLYLARRGDPGADGRRFFASMVADLCLVRAL
jgi:hypothetical protein